MFSKNNFLLLIALILISKSILVFTIHKTPRILGDGPEYYMMSESFLNHATPEMKREDKNTTINNSKHFGYHFTYINYTPFPGYYKSLDNKFYSYHFFSYPLLVTPIKYVLNIFNINDLKSFPLTNAILFITMIWLLYFKLNLPTTQKISLLLLVIFNPILYYLDWLHPEVFTYVFTVLSLMYYINKSYKSSYALMAIASWQNPPVIFFSLLIFMAHSFQYFKQQQYKKIISEGASLSLFILPMLFYYYNFGVLNLIVAKGFSSIHNITWNKIWDLYFGLVHGMILSSAVILIAFFSAIIKTFKQQNFTLFNVVLLLAIILMSIAVTTTSNWNSAMYYVIRYATWIYVFIIYFVVCNIRNRLLLISYINSICFICYHLLNPSFSGLALNKVSQYLLQNAPAVLIIDKQTFCQTAHYQGGYLDANKNPYPCILIDNNLYVKKIYTDLNGLNRFLKSKKYYINKQTRENIHRKYAHKKGGFFININENTISQKYFRYSGATLPSMIGKKQATYVTTNSTAPGFITYGPDITLPLGTYKFNTSYVSSSPKTTVVGRWYVGAFTATESKQLKTGNLIGTNNQPGHIVQSFTISNEYAHKPMQIRNYYNGIGDLTIRSLTITRVQ